MRSRTRRPWSRRSKRRPVATALARYQADRKPVVQKLVAAARTSADWYEKFPDHMQLDPFAFAYSYITRSGRIDDARLRAMSPRFMAAYEAASQAAAAKETDRKTAAE